MTVIPFADVPQRNVQHDPKRGWRSAVRRQMAEASFARPVDVKLHRAILSVCFDDFTRSAATTGAQALERVDARATFYACAGLMGEESPSGALFEAEDLHRLEANGHEIGCHTFLHTTCAEETDAALSACARNTIELSLMGLSRPVRSIAYPAGETSSSFKRALPKDFVAARGAAPGLNRGKVDLAQLKAFPFYGWTTSEPLLAALDKAEQTGAWMIVFTHDVASEPSPWGAPTGALGALLRKARALKMDILPVCDAADRVLAAQRKLAR